MDTSENDNISILGGEGVAKKRSKIRKRHINSVYEDQHINGDEMPIDSSKSSETSSTMSITGNGSERTVSSSNSPAAV